MSSSTVQRKTQKQFLDIPSAAFQAGYSSRHFRRIIEEDKIPVMQIGGNSSSLPGTSKHGNLPRVKQDFSKLSSNLMYG